MVCFFVGKPNVALKLAKQVFRDNEGRNYYHGILAFSLVENGRIEDAEKEGKRGLEINEHDIWCQHSVCHALQYQCKFKEALDLMTRSSETWDPKKTTLYRHNWWHIALLHLEAEHPMHTITTVYNNTLIRLGSKANVDSLNLLLRMYIRGKGEYVKEQLQGIKGTLKTKKVWHKEPHLDVLIVWALSTLGEMSIAEHLLLSMNNRYSHMSALKREEMARVVQLARACSAYGMKNYPETLMFLGPYLHAKHYKALGASDEQLDAFNELICSALLETGNVDQAKEAIIGHIESRGGAPFWRRQLLTYSS